MSASSAHAIGTPSGSTTVAYDPNTLKSIEAELPVSWSYPVRITAPILSAPTTATLIAQPTQMPAGVSLATASSYLTFSQPTLTFTSTGQELSVTVTFTAPLGAPTGDYTYFITCSGWPAGTTDNGTFINMHAIPPSSLLTPTVEIQTPADGTEFIYTVGGPAVPVDILITGSAPQNAPVLFLTATIRGVDANGNVILPQMPLALVLEGLGTPNALGRLTLPISVPGTYTINTQDQNSQGTASDSATFVVRSYVPPPVVVIDPPKNNPVYTYDRGLTSVTVPYTYVATSILGGIQTLTATLDGNPITTATVTGIGELVSTGTGTFTFSSATINGLGTHTIDVVATNEYGSATTSATFVVAERIPAISIDISNPLDGSSIPLPPDASPLNIPYNFTSVTTLNAPIKTVAATLTSEGVISALSLSSTSGLNTSSVAGSGTLVNVAAGVYVINATSANPALDLSAFDSTQFTVTPPPPPVIVFTQSPQPSYTVLTGYTQSIPVAVKTTSTGTTSNPGPAYISTQSLTLDGQPVTLTANTANGTAFTATGGATITVAAPAPGTTETHVLTASGTDAYGQPTTTQTSFDVVGKDPVITIAINPEITANSPYTLPTGGSVSIPFKFTGNITTGATVDTITGALGSSAVTITSYTGLGSSSTATGSGVMTITAPGTYTLTATDTNTKSGISATTSVQFVVQQSQALPPLTVAITQPPAASYTLVNGCSALSIPITFVGKSNSGNSGGYVSTMSATLDGNPITLATLSGIGSPTATATATLSVRTAGTHILVVKDTDKYSQTATASATFVVTIQNPVISIAINNPSNNACFVLPCSTGGCGSTSSLSIPFTFTSTITAGATIDCQSALLNGCSVTVTSTGLGTANAQGSGTLVVKQTGTYTLTAKAVNKATGLSATTSITFTVRKANPPSVTITAPTASSYSVSSCSALSIPFVFSAVSECGGIQSLSATLDGVCVNVTSTGIGTLNATGSGTLSVKCAGTHKLTVTAKDQNGTACATKTFTVTVTPCVKYTLQGTVFFDINFNGLMDTDDYGLSGVKVTVFDSSGYGVATASTDANGGYSFSLPTGSYTVRADAVNGMSLTTLNDNQVSLTNGNITAPNIGYGLKFAAIRNLCANGFTIGYWKNNVDKALACKTSGAQVSAANIKTYTTKMGSFSLEPFTGITMSTASATMGSTSSDPAALLAKQLVASEYNCISGAYIGGDARLTLAFITYAESVLKRQSTYSSTYLIFVKDWCDAYNNSHGGKVYGPLP